MSFKVASKFREAAVVVNKIPADKFPFLLGRVAQKLHVANSRLFSEQEEDQLRTMFDLTAYDLGLALDGCCYIFEQSAYSSTGPEQLYEILLETGFAESHAKIIGKSWASEAAAFMGKLKERSIHPKVLESTDHRLDILMATSSLTKVAEPTALMDFNIKHVDEKRSEKVQLEFSHDELYDFFLQLDRMQQQLDNLSATS